MASMSCSVTLMMSCFLTDKTQRNLVNVFVSRPCWAQLPVCAPLVSSSSMVVFVLSDDSYKNNLSHHDVSLVFIFLFLILASNICSLFTINESLFTPDWLLKERKWQIYLVAFWLTFPSAEKVKKNHLDSISFLVSTLSSWTRNEDKNQENQQSHKEINKSTKNIQRRHRTDDPPTDSFKRNL